MTNPVVYTSKIRIERVKGPERRAYMPVEEEPVMFGTHHAIAGPYGADMSKLVPHSTTLDYIVAAAAG